MTVFVPIVYFALMVYSKQVSKFIESKGYILQLKNDHQFMEEVYQILDKHFNYRVSVVLN